jgi:hypothetical protein
MYEIAGKSNKHENHHGNLGYFGNSQLSRTQAKSNCLFGKVISVENF